MAKLPEGRSTLTDEQMIGLTHRLVDTCIDCKGRIEELEERLKAAQDDAKEAEAYAGELEKQCEGLMRAGMNNGQALILAEAKLAKAVDVIEWALIAWDDHCQHGYNMQGDWVHDARIAIAELTGGKHD